MGIFMQAAGNALGAEISDLRNYVMANLLWDPTKSGTKLANEFLDLHYGRAGELIRRFINLTHEKALASGLHPNCFGRAKDYAIDEAIAQAGLDAFAEAMKLAENDAARARVEKASVCAYRAAIEPIWYMKDDSTVDPDLAKRMRPLVKRFLELCKNPALCAEVMLTAVDKLGVDAAIIFSDGSIPTYSRTSGEKWSVVRPPPTPMSSMRASASVSRSSPRTLSSGG